MWRERLGATAGLLWSWGWNWNLTFRGADRWRSAAGLAASPDEVVCGFLGSAGCSRDDSLPVQNVKNSLCSFKTDTYLKWMYSPIICMEWSGNYNVLYLQKTKVTSSLVFLWDSHVCQWVDHCFLYHLLGSTPLLLLVFEKCLHPW